MRPVLVLVEEERKVNEPDKSPPRKSRSSISTTICEGRKLGLRNGDTAGNPRVFGMECRSRKRRRPTVCGGILLLLLLTLQLLLSHASQEERSSTAKDQGPRILSSARAILDDPGMRVYAEAFSNSTRKRQEEEEEEKKKESGGHEAGQQIKEQDDSSRRLAGAVYTRSNTPKMFPGGGSFVHPIAVTFVSDRSIDRVYYTLDGTEPSMESPYVVSGGSIGLYSSSVVNARAGPDDNDETSSTLSDTFSQDFTIYEEGKCGTAIMVPYYTEAGHSNTVVELNLGTHLFNSVRMHGVYTDFADFFSSSGIGPYQGQVTERNLANSTSADSSSSSSTGSDNDLGLRGYWGGFSTRVNGTALGFMSPHFDGTAYHGKAVQVAMGAFSTSNNTAFCPPTADVLAQDVTSNSSCVFRVVDLEEVDEDLKGFSGGFAFDSKAYFVPTFTGRKTGNKLVRISIGSFSSSDVEVLDLSLLDNEVGGFSGGFEWEGAGFLVPSRSYTAPYGGINSNLTVDGYYGIDFPTAGQEVQRKAGGLLSTHYSGKMVRVNLTTFALPDASVMDLTRVDPDLRGFMGGFAAGKYGFLVPFRNQEGRGLFSGKIARVDLEAWGDYSAVSVIDLTQRDPSLEGFVGGFNHGKYAVFVPYMNGDTENNYNERKQHSKVVFVDIEDFTLSSVRVVDLASQERQQIPSMADQDLRGFVGGFSLGQHVYLAPHFNGIFFGKVVRIDVRDVDVMDMGGTPSGQDGLQTVDLSDDGDTRRTGFSGMFHSFDTSCE